MSFSSLENSIRINTYQKLLFNTHCAETMIIPSLIIEKMVFQFSLNSRTYMFIPEKKLRGDSGKGKSDKPLKSIIKSITWRIVGTTDTIIISYLLTGKIYLAFSIGSIELFSKMLLYYLHERAWSNLPWEKVTTRVGRTYKKIILSLRAVFSSRSLNPSRYVAENR